MGMFEISEKHRSGGIGRAMRDLKETLECLKEDFENVVEEFESLGERDERYNMGDYDNLRERNRDDRYWDDERMGERRGRRRRR
jgi:predicted nuclease with TOPRIM domain